MHSPATAKVISIIYSCWCCGWLPWQLKPLASTRASDAILMTVCPPLRALPLPVCELLEPWWCTSWEALGLTRAVTQGTCTGAGVDFYHAGRVPCVRSHCTWIALLKWERITFSQVLCCAFIHYYQCNSALCLGCLTAITSEKNISLYSLELDWGQSEWQTPCSQNCLSSSRYRSWLSKQAWRGIVLLVQEESCSGLLASLNG